MAIYALSSAMPACTLSTRRKGQGRKLPGWNSGILLKMRVPDRL